MKRGFPRPAFKLEHVHTNRPDGREYEGNWKGKTFPLPYSSKDYSISVSDRGRMKECILFKKCVACGDPVDGDNVCLLLYNPDNTGTKKRYSDWIHAESGPFHEKCLRLTLSMCPHIAEGDSFVPGYGEWRVVKPLISAHYTW